MLNASVCLDTLCPILSWPFHFLLLIRVYVDPICHSSETHIFYTGSSVDLSTLYHVSFYIVSEPAFHSHSQYAVYFPCVHHRVHIYLTHLTHIFIFSTNLCSSSCAAINKLSVSFFKLPLLSQYQIHLSLCLLVFS